MFFLTALKDFLENFFSILFQDKFFKIAFGSAVGLNLIIWVFICFVFLPLRSLDNLTFLHYNVYFGINLVGKWYEIFIIPFVGIFIILINLILFRLLFLREKIIKYFLGIITLTSQIFLLIASFMISLINR